MKLLETLFLNSTMTNYYVCSFEKFIPSASESSRKSTHSLKNTSNADNCFKYWMMKVTRAFERIAKNNDRLKEGFTQNNFVYMCEMSCSSRHATAFDTIYVTTYIETRPSPVE